MSDWFQLLLAAVLIGTIILAATGPDLDRPRAEETTDEWEAKQW